MKLKCGSLTAPSAGGVYHLFVSLRMYRQEFSNRIKTATG